jgi:hypothetical protein
MSLGLGIHPNTAKITMGKFGPAYHLVKKAQDSVYKELETPQHKLEVRNFPIELDETTASSNSSRLLSHQGYIYISQTNAAVPEEAALAQAHPFISKCRLNPHPGRNCKLFRTVPFLDVFLVE